MSSDDSSDDENFDANDGSIFQIKKRPLAQEASEQSSATKKVTPNVSSSARLDTVRFKVKPESEIYDQSSEKVRVVASTPWLAAETQLLLDLVAQNTQIRNGKPLIDWHEILKHMNPGRNAKMCQGRLRCLKQQEERKSGIVSSRPSKSRKNKDDEEEEEEEVEDDGNDYIFPTAVKIEEYSTKPPNNPFQQYIITEVTRPSKLPTQYIPQQAGGKRPTNPNTEFVPYTGVKPSLFGNANRTSENCWDEREIEIMIDLIPKHKTVVFGAVKIDWVSIVNSRLLGDRSKASIKKKYYSLKLVDQLPAEAVTLQEDMNFWSDEETLYLSQLIRENCDFVNGKAHKIRWLEITKLMNGRSADSCKLKYKRHLNEVVEEEEEEDDGKD